MPRRDSHRPHEEEDDDDGAESLRDDEDPDESDTDDDDPELVPCPFCREPVSEDAELCPHCRNFIVHDQPRRTPWWVIAGAVLCLAAALLWVLGALTR